MTKELDPEWEELKRRSLEHLGYVDETALVVLKGHLLIEESLNSIISAFVFHPEFIQEANLRFAQKLSIARSISLDDHQNEMWKIATKLNSLRNELAHELNSPKRAEKTQAVINLYFRLAADMPDFEKLNEQPEHVLLAFAVGFFLGFLRGFQREVNRFKESIDELDRVYNPHRHRT